MTQDLPVLTAIELHHQAFPVSGSGERLTIILRQMPEGCEAYKSDLGLVNGVPLDGTFFR
jgi:hypothetical protein